MTGGPLVKRIAGILYPDDERLDWVLDGLTRLWGEPDLVSEPVPFDKTSYYQDIAPDLTRRFACFPGLADAGGLADWKHQSHELEEESARLAGRPLRTVNIDPGYVDGARLVLASTKDHAHRVWLRDGIYAEVTLRYRFGKWESFDYTFPDFRSGVYDIFLSSARKLWLRERGSAS
ncbi:MAG: DUF4416 family protein [Synergistaceae bacterium]|nr:DUF4416 family protein [Synergistaceae bacterium]